GGVTPQIHTLEDPFRIVVELPKAVSKPDVAAAPPDGRVGTLPTLRPGTKPADLPPQKDWDERAVRRVVIDAGHGGKGPGALGADDLHEARVALGIARELGKVLESRGFEVILPRDRDVFLPLGERTDIANRKDADLFLSVHANAAKSRKLAGVETYLLDT